MNIQNIRLEIVKFIKYMTHSFNTPHIVGMIAI